MPRRGTFCSRARRRASRSPERSARAPCRSSARRCYTRPAPPSTTAGRWEGFTAERWSPSSTLSCSIPPHLSGSPSGPSRRLSATTSSWLTSGPGSSRKGSSHGSKPQSQIACRTTTTSRQGPLRSLCSRSFTTVLKQGVEGGVRANLSPFRVPLTPRLSLLASTCVARFRPVSCSYCTNVICE